MEVVGAKSLYRVAEGWQKQHSYSKMTSVNSSTALHVYVEVRGIKQVLRLQILFIGNVYD